MGGVQATLTGTVLIPREKILRKIAALAPAIIRERTRNGIDVDGNPFAPYSTGYAKARSEAGYSTAPVSLTDSGGLLNALRTSVESDHVSIQPGTGASRKTPLTKGKSDNPSQAIVGKWLHDGAGKLPPRPWLGMSDADHASLKRQLIDSGALIPE